MATTSKLRTQKTTSAQANNGQPYGDIEAAVEIIINAVTGGIPTWDNRAFTYYGSTNNAHVVTYKLGSTTVATVTYTYVAAGAADDDDVLTETLAVS